VTRRLLAGYLSITLIVLVLLEVPLGFVFSNLERNRLAGGVRDDAVTMALFAAEPLRTGDNAALDMMVERYRRQKGGRVVVIGPDGRARADSDRVGAEPELFSGRTEIAAALAGRPAEGYRYSVTLGHKLFFEAVPVNSGGTVWGAVRITYPASVVDRRIRRTWVLLGGLGLAVVAAVAAVSRRVARSVTAPLRILEGAAAGFGQGQLDIRVPSQAGPPELRVLATVFNDMAARLERLLESQRAFVADASHQLRTPLAALRLRLEIVDRAAPQATRDDIAKALEEVHRLSRLVDGLLALAAADHQASRPEPVDVAAVAAGRRDIWAPFAEEHGAGVEVRLEPAVALATAGNVEQVLDNLIANALDVSPRGGTVTITVVAGPEWIDLHVIDQGPGMTAERRARAFTRFWRAPDRSRRVGGSGLGLTIVRQLVEGDGGGVALLDAAGGGIDAHVRLRVVPSGPGDGDLRRYRGPAGRADDQWSSPHPARS
jgi:signal transduction histidine kinase